MAIKSMYVDIKQSELTEELLICTTIHNYCKHSKIKTVHCLITTT